MVGHPVIQIINRLANVGSYLHIICYFWQQKKYLTRVRDLFFQFQSKPNTLHNKLSGEVFSKKFRRFQIYLLLFQVFYY